jgi:hypothetical protein
MDILSALKGSNYYINMKIHIFQNYFGKVKMVY